MRGGDPSDLPAADGDGASGGNNGSGTAVDGSCSPAPGGAVRERAPARAMAFGSGCCEAAGEIIGGFDSWNFLLPVVTVVTDQILSVTNDLVVT